MERLELDGCVCLSFTHLGRYWLDEYDQPRSNVVLLSEGLELLADVHVCPYRTRLGPPDEPRSVTMQRELERLVDGRFCLCLQSLPRPT
eukprot:355528-Chlamydomonas_euryale.AAC.10